jgi:hypothetical protein
VNRTRRIASAIKYLQKEGYTVTAPAVQHLPTRRLPGAVTTPPASQPASPPIADPPPTVKGER